MSSRPSWAINCGSSAGSATSARASQTRKLFLGGALTEIRQQFLPVAVACGTRGVFRGGAHEGDSGGRAGWLLFGRCHHLLSRLGRQAPHPQETVPAEPSRQFVGRDEQLGQPLLGLGNTGIEQDPPGEHDHRSAFAARGPGERLLEFPRNLVAELGQRFQGVQAVGRRRIEEHVPDLSHPGGAAAFFGVRLRQHPPHTDPVFRFLFVGGAFPLKGLPHRFPVVELQQVLGRMDLDPALLVAKHRLQRRDAALAQFGVVRSEAVKEFTWASLSETRCWSRRDQSTCFRSGKLTAGQACRPQHCHQQEQGKPQGLESHATPRCVARNPGNLYVAAFARMRAFPAFPNSGEFSYLPETTATHTPLCPLIRRRNVVHIRHSRKRAADSFPVRSCHRAVCSALVYRERRRNTIDWPAQPE